MRKSKQTAQADIPTVGEHRLLEILWRIGEGTIDDILGASDETPSPNYKTVQTLLRIMERKGQINHEQVGRAFVYRPLLKRGEVRRSSIREFLAKYFTGSRTELLMELLSDKRISQEELKQLELMIRNRRKR